MEVLILTKLLQRGGAAGGFMLYPLKTCVLKSSLHNVVVFGDRDFGKVIR